MEKYEFSKKVLVIDDDIIVLLAIERLFVRSGLTIDTASTFDEARRCIDQNMYQVIITDLKFSDTIDEAGLVISVYAKQKIPGVKVILWTGVNLSEIFEKAKVANVDLCLGKPMSPNVILKTVVDSNS